ncbi:hypothetical protein ACH47C_01570 [Streptomyces rishiriensis]|uniref:hypothetical protein n=1 Tax=Streptomyces rishiriensis TaxID=68264 RepID=UPI0033FF5E13
MSAPTLQTAFVDWTSADPVRDRASGVLGDVAVSIEGPLGNSLISNEYDGYGWSAFEPELPLSDAVEVRGSAPGSDFVVTFDPPVRQPVFDVASLASTMKFTNLPPGARAEKLSGDVDFDASGDTVRGKAHEAAVNSEGILVTDSNGTIRLTGDHEYGSVRFTLTPNFTASVPDGVLLQIGGLIRPPAFVDWTSADPAQDRATGVLGDVAVSIEGPLGTSFISNEYDGYGWSAFEPELPFSDAVEVRSAPGRNFEVKFKPKVRNPIFYIASLASTMKFTNLPPGARAEKLSGDADFDASGDTVRGKAHEAAVNSEGILVTDSNGTIRLTGDHEYGSVRFTLTPNFTASVPDGVMIQIGIGG